MKRLRQRRHNGFYKFRRLVIQILLKDSDGFLLHLLPQISIGINSMCSFAVAFEWLFGTVNFGIMTKDFQQREIEREKRLAELAAKSGLTKKQYQLNWA
jgi:hypothetical protein